MTTSYSAFYNSGLHAHAASVYTYNHPHDEDMEHENASHSSTGDLAYFPAASTYYNPPHNSTRAQSPSRAHGARSPSRKRRSSITSSASPVSSMKLARSPARAAGNAWHVANVASRSRSGSLISNVASEDNSMLGRMRSGSVGTRLRGRKPLTNQRPVALLFAPTPPPPSAPLPRLAVMYFTSSPPSRPSPPLPAQNATTPPGIWMGFGTIDEEMKEN
ncbi:hypothetical protein MVEN_01028300 [Mycena venus]|uniref:Uncharacterized protein n=1 Tax=Mycena venus TaxID=2733690 RepID=A0A8H6YDC5_9AGAR|nr:hypothetical protein MVEN_01028300 [Mycena venus]